ncbi:MAG: NifB/NifX family molybdenum-iron cluster-binding protein [Armatimonadota bacterium]
MNVELRLNNHPCFNPHAAGRFGRVHLPIAPACNMQCKYCNRKHDCVNESRPGVTSSVLAPGQALKYLERVMEVETRTSVVGIAGPGDAFATPDLTMKTLRLVRKRFPELLLCIASNGLNIGPYIDELMTMNVSHVTLTINAVDPSIGSKIYAWVRDGKKVYRKEEAAALLLERQIAAVKSLKQSCVTVKVNTIIIPSVNEDHIVAVAEKMAELGVDLLNCMPMHPTRGSSFEELPEPSKVTVAEIQQQAGGFIPQMLHCTRCRADAVGLLCEDRTSEMMSCLKACSQMPLNPEDDRPYVAVASLEGALVNQHLGEASKFLIYAQTNRGCEMIDTRPAPAKGGGEGRWNELTETLSDCRAALVSAVGESPREVLQSNGIDVIVTSGFIEDCVELVFSGIRPKSSPRQTSCRGGGPNGPGGGCG